MQYWISKRPEQSRQQDHFFSELRFAKRELAQEPTLFQGDPSRDGTMAAPAKRELVLPILTVSRRGTNGSGQKKGFAAGGTIRRDFPTVRREPLDG
jgi:hypothetical protein